MAKRGITAISKPNVPKMTLHHYRGDPSLTNDTRNESLPSLLATSFRRRECQVNVVRKNT
jgi:hypothetical protein